VHRWTNCLDSDLACSLPTDVLLAEGTEQGHSVPFLLHEQESLECRLQREQCGASGVIGYLGH
jgi:hypothetical protein